ncbi:hypothetical protein SAMN02799630_02788 [Paenibacillus sp. UNCCL117]|uniref:hypothetical protein n=1 Tax=unclassified Paenibacillus TaxID=185978 RepID=UPI00088599D0|nr:MULTISPECIES: hypothetical protein [unclassified Paenibacillus]SDD27429.1 hypothetical protein SAMN04488602_107124 [Paenibacillus sp. cl123]SFW40539.1 hypothetical protein SAMN02799630_02788 [Paenibacillus sp. UNCCL117]
MNEQEKELYSEQIKLWFEEQVIIRRELERTHESHQALAELNRKQLQLHNARINIAVTEYNEWAAANAYPSL